MTSESAGFFHNTGGEPEAPDRTGDRTLLFFFGDYLDLEAGLNSWSEVHWFLRGSSDKRPSVLYRGA